VADKKVALEEAEEFNPYKHINLEIDRLCKSDVRSVAIKSFHVDEVRGFTTVDLSVDRKVVRGVAKRAKGDKHDPAIGLSIAVARALEAADALNRTRRKPRSNGKTLALVVQHAIKRFDEGKDIHPAEILMLVDNPVAFIPPDTDEQPQLVTS